MTNMARDICLHCYLKKGLRLKEIVQTPTRVTLDSTTCIDHIVWNREEMYSRAGALHIEINHHCLLLCQETSGKL